MGRLVLLICILNPGESRDQARTKASAERQVDSGELEQILCVTTQSMYPLLVHGARSPICNIHFPRYLSEGTE